MASFWFLDTLALQVRRHRKHLDDYYLSVLISWLVGETMLIRDEKPSREEFLRETKKIFDVAANRVSEENRLVYWDEIVRKDEEDEEEEEEEEEDSIDRESKQVLLKSLQVAQSKNLQSNTNKTESASKGTENQSFAVEVDQVFSNLDPVFVLDIVIQSTYDTYANEMRYALVYAVFVDQIELQMYQLPFVLRTPRPVKLVKPKAAPFKVSLQDRLKKTGVVEKSKKREKKAGKRRTKTRNGVPPTPPPSLSDEEILMHKRQFILPLIEADEAPDMFEPPAGDT